MKRDTYTRAEILAALTLRPCHRDTEHHEHACREQVAETVGAVLTLLDVSEEELPRQLHAPGCWNCHAPEEASGGDAAKAASARAWVAAGKAVPA